MSAATMRLARKLTLTLPALAFHAEGKHLLRYYARCVVDALSPAVSTTCPKQCHPCDLR
jgi:hypothetical protein